MLKNPLCPFLYGIHMKCFKTQQDTLLPPQRTEGGRCMQQRRRRPGLGIAHYCHRVRGARSGGSPGLRWLPFPPYLHTYSPNLLPARTFGKHTTGAVSALLFCKTSAFTHPVCNAPRAGGLETVSATPFEKSSTKQMLRGGTAQPLVIREEDRKYYLSPSTVVSLLCHLSVV